MPVVEIKGLPEFRRELKAASAALPKEMRKMQKELADDVAAKARGIASGLGGEAAKGAGMIRGYATQANASVGVPSRTVASAATWGTLRRTGWYAAARYSGSTRQHPAWVGNSWEPGVAGQGPRAINDALAAEWTNILVRYVQMIDKLLKQAYPD